MNYQSWWKRSTAEVPVTCGLVVLLLGVYAATVVESGSLTHNLDGWIGDHWATYPPLMSVLPFGPLRAVGGMILHNGPTHVLFNSFMLFLLGADLERALGSRVVGLMFLVGGLGASAAEVFFAWNVFTVGASGAVFALMAVLMKLRVRTGGDVRSVLWLIVANVGFTFLGSNISIAGHLGGLITGIVMGAGLWWARSSRVFGTWVAMTGVMSVLLIGVGLL